ncbi:hypothetical protein A9Q89_12050 [Gammaproteobacteria bacterium 53_120_T64]|nr:hypothetical protein A9Q89_12050 [Gammaproteobacteria bacterium 53_120_T64]
MDVQNIGGAVNRGVQQEASSVAGAISADQNVASNNASARDSQVTLSTTSPGDAQKILNQQLQSALSKVQETESPSRLSTLDTNSGSPSQVAGQTLSTIQRGLADIADTAEPEERVDFLNEATQDVRQGFAEARDLLSNISARVDEVRGNIDATEKLVERGVESIRSELASESAPENGTPADQLVS